MDNGVAVGLVVGTDDPADLGRIRVSVPRMDDIARWARVVRPNVAKAEFLAPEVGDEVLVIFESGDLDQPYVIGALSPRNPPDVDE